MEFRVGARFKSAVCTTEVVVVKSPKEGDELRCGGVAMVPVSLEAPQGVCIADDSRGGTLVGKRYVSEDQEFEVLCTKSGEGSLAIGKMSLSQKVAKPLPPSD